MPTATISSKGQITIPLEIRQHFGLHAGTRVDFLINEDRFEGYPITRSVMDLKGILRYDGSPITIDEMNETIADAASESMNK